VLGTSNLTGRSPSYWLTIVAVLTVSNALLRIWFAGSTASESACDGVRLNLLMSALALALSVGIGIIRPRWWHRAMVLLAHVSSIAEHHRSAFTDGIA
jgi:hypothetical protein